MERYKTYKDDYWDEGTDIQELRWNGSTAGVRDFFEALLKELSSGTYELTTLGKLEKHVRKNQKA
jgi:hypothetical protein